VITHALDCTWRSKMAFTVALDGRELPLDAGPSAGGDGAGFRPKPLLLAALAGCTGMDVVTILAKMRQPLSHFRVHVEGDLTDATPATYAAMRVIYELSRADGLDPAKVERAVQLSKEKYCGVSAMLKHASDIHFEIRWVD
jgi:putative redox protein